MSEPIAIVGISCLYPGASTPLEFWDNVLAQRRAFRRLPHERLRSEDYFDSDPKAADKTYSPHAAVIEGYEFDRAGFRVVGSTYRSADLAHWLALDIASKSLTDAGFPNAAGLPKETTGVIIGNTLTGEFSRANIMRLRWPYVRRVLASALFEKNFDCAELEEFLQRLEITYKNPFPEVGEETLAGGLSNTIAGRICNHFDLKGGGYTVDGACASSLLAVANACSALIAGDLDVALAGGVDLSLDPFELVGFAKTGALAPELMRIYDTRSSGFWPGEGCGFIVLMRYQDALAGGRRIYSMIRGWGISSDGAGGITRPEVDGQLHALTRAYSRANYGIDTVEYFEGHGTGTAVGDATELEAISKARLENRSDAAPAVIGSVKANIGHTKAAAGVAGLIKAAFALQTQILPPTTGCDTPHPLATGSAAALRVLREPEPWPSNRLLRASVSSMGFGGINAHICLEGVHTERRRALSSHEKNLARSPQDAEIFAFCAGNAQALEQQIKNAFGFAARISFSELTDVASELAKRSDGGPARAAFIASTPAELALRLQKFLEEAPRRLDFENASFAAEKYTNPRIGFLFPGQGSPANLTGGIYRRRFDCVASVYDMAQLPADSDGVATKIAQPAIVTASLAGLAALRHVRLTANVGLGHSLGEITALHWAGSFGAESLLRIARTRGEAMAQLGSPTGAMAAISASAPEVRSLVNGHVISIVGLNSPRQTVISGEARSVQAVATLARARGYRTVKLQVSHAFHTELVAAATPALAQRLAEEDIQPPGFDIVSTVTGRRLESDANLRDLLCKQVTSPVLFIDAVSEAAKDADLFIEVGSGGVLAGLVSEIVDKPVVSLDAGGPSLKGFLQAVAAAYVLGAPVRLSALFEDRFTRPFNLDWRPKFFVSPCELAPTDHVPKAETKSCVAADETPQTPSNEKETPADLLRRLIAEKTELPLNTVSVDSRFLSDLHLNSISVGQLIADAARRLNLPPLLDVTKFANTTVTQAAAALEQLGENGGSQNSSARNVAPAGVDSWVQAFELKWIPYNIPRGALQNPEQPANWLVFAPKHHPLQKPLLTACAAIPGQGAICVLGESTGVLLEAARAALSLPHPAQFVIIQSEAKASGFAKTFHLEHPEIIVRVLTVCPGETAFTWLAHELSSKDRFIEASYDQGGIRRVPRLTLAALPESDGEYLITANDVLLVTGGGKGIGAECAIALARATGVRLLIVGRTKEDNEPELAANFERMRTAKVQFAYVSVDITDRDAVAAAIHNAEARLGKITALLHAAGRNIPKLIESLTPQDLRDTAAPKVAGLQNIIGAIDRNQLRLLVTFGSMIARTGLAGEADYALANESLAEITNQFQSDNPNCRCIAMEWSVWSGIGMGQRLGRIESLMQQGITPIPPEVGVQIFLRLIRSRASSPNLVITGRFGGPPTLQLEQVELPFQRFLEKSILYYPGVELITESTLSTDSDLYIKDHAFQGELLFPAVMGLEAMAQTAMALAGSEEPPSFEGVELLRPVVIPKGGRSTVRVCALARATHEIEVCLRSDQTGFQTDHFRATCRFQTSAESLRNSQTPYTINIAEHTLPIDLDAVRDIYERLLFHTGRFRRLLNYRRLRAHECIAQLEPDRETPWFGRYLPQHRILGDSGVRDAAIHAIQACIPHARLLPVSVEQISLGKVPCLFERSHGKNRAPQLLVHAWQTKREGDEFFYNLELLAEDGSMLERWQNLRLRKVEVIAPKEPWPLALLGPYIERRLEELIPDQPVKVRVHTRSTPGAQSRTDALDYRADGKPETAANTCISRSHSDSVTLFVESKAPVGCDIEVVTSRSECDWRGILGTRAALAETVVAESRIGFHVAATCIWTAIECIKKAGLASHSPLSFEKYTEDHWLILRCGRAIIACHQVAIQNSASKFIMSILAANATKR